MVKDKNKGSEKIACERVTEPRQQEIICDTHFDVLESTNALGQPILRGIIIASNSLKYYEVFGFNVMKGAPSEVQRAKNLNLNEKNYTTLKETKFIQVDLFAQ